MCDVLKFILGSFDGKGNGEYPGKVKGTTPLLRHQTLAPADDYRRRSRKDLKRMVGRVGVEPTAR